MVPNAGSLETPQDTQEEVFSEVEAAPTLLTTSPSTPAVSEPTAFLQDDIISKIERLAGLRSKGIISDEEFAAKKTELLERL